jgi:tetratricopeptide (TPR) repeat protein
MNLRYHTLLALVAVSAPTLLAQSASEHVALGDSAQTAFHPSEALKHYEAAIALEPRNADALTRASRSAVDVGESEASAARKKELFTLGASYARRAVDANPNVAEAHFALARALGRAALSVGVRDRVHYGVEVRDEALAALRIDPNHPGALHVLGMWNAEVMRLNGFERFVAQNVLGGKIMSQANWKDAVSNLERAVEIDPDRLSHHLDLAKIYADVGEKAKARQQYEWVTGASRQTDANDPLYKRQAQEGLARLK